VTAPVRLIGRLRSADPALSAMVAEGFLSRLSFGIVSFALPLYALELGLGVAAIGVLASLNLMVAVALKPLAGWVADRVGLKLSLTAAIVLRSAVSLLLALATVPWQLFATRSVHGVSIALRDPAVNALIAEGATKERIASAFAWYQTAKSVAGSLGKVLAGLAIAATASSFSLVFGFAFLLSALPAWVVIRYVREPDRGSTALESGGVAGAPGDGVPEQEPARPAGVLRFAGVGFAISGTGHMLSTLFPVLAVEYAGLTVAQAGLLYSISAAVALLGPGFGWLSDNVSRRLVLQTRGFANVFSSALYLVAPSLPGFAAGKAVDDAGKAAFRPAWGALMAHVSSFDRRRRAQLMGYMSAGEDAGEMAGPILAGLLWGTFGAPVLLVARMGLALGAEVFTWRMTRGLEDGPRVRRGAREAGESPRSRRGAGEAQESPSGSAGSRPERSSPPESSRAAVGADSSSSAVSTSAGS
jgi:MFS family permease